MKYPSQKNPKSLQDFAPVGTKDCQSICDRDVIMTNQGPIVICYGCRRIVMDNRKQNLNQQ